MPLLKSGQYISDPRLTRIQQFDSRSRLYGATDTVKQNPPRSYTWSCDLTLDQGVQGMCVGAAFTHELAAKPAVVKNVDIQFAKSLYFEAQRQDGWPGGEYPGASPIYSGTSVLAGAKVVKTLGYVKEYRWAFGLEDLILAVGYKGPAVLGLDWYTDMFDVDGNGYISASGQVEGGHCILCKAVNVKKEYFVLHNSWGPTWGVNGDAKITFDDMNYLLQSGGEACIPGGRVASKSILQFLKDLFV